jgi:hypothetical protein
MALMIEDLPTLLLPMNAYSGACSFGQRSKLGLDIK